jgi:hypothetical protein
VLKGQTNTVHKTNANQNITQPAGRSASHMVPQANPAAVIQRAMADPGSLSPGEILQLQRSVGNHSVSLLLGGAIKQQPPEKKAISEETPGGLPHPPETPMGEENGNLEENCPTIAVPIGGGHHVTARESGGVMRLGVASEFTEVSAIVSTLLDLSSPLNKTQREVVKQISEDVTKAEAEMNKAKLLYDSQNEKKIKLRDIVTIAIESDYGPRKKRIDGSHARHGEFENAIKLTEELKDEYLRKTTIAVNLAKDAIIKLWEIGKDFLPTNLMPVGAVFRDRNTFGGDTGRYTYHTGDSKGDAVPITWYKNPADYPRLKLKDTTVINFGQSFKVGGLNFGLNTENKPKADWFIQKTAHNDSREGQHLFNKTLIDEEVQVEKGSSFVSPPLGDTHHFDGDHVKDLGFGGKDQADNYWPLDSTINRRAFAGYNAGYVVHYKDEKGEHKSRSIGGLVGKWFVVKRFLNSTDAAIPTDGALAGGTPK